MSPVKNADNLLFLAGPVPYALTTEHLRLDHMAVELAGFDLGRAQSLIDRVDALP